MPPPTDPFAADWESFRFPVRPVRMFAPDPAHRDLACDEEEGDGDGDAQGKAGDSGAPALEPGWLYCPEHDDLRHQGLGKRILLSALDTVPKIIRLLATVQARPELDVDSLIDALEFAVWDHYGYGMETLMEANTPGRRIDWPTPAAPHARSVPSRHL